MNWSNFVYIVVFLSLCSCNQKTRIISPPAQNTQQGSIVLNDHQRLKKMSVHIRGLFPELEEYEALNKAIETKTQKEFFAKKSQEYLASKQHVAKMNARLDELFRLKVAAGLSERNHNLPEQVDLESMDILNSLDFLFQNIIKKNLSWDTLLLSKEYFILSPGFSYKVFGGNDQQFFSEVKPEVLIIPNPPSGTYTLTSVSFDEKDPRIGGVLTTNRFFDRYTTTTLNRSRGRAAAVFRIFLCDDMKAAIEPKDNEEKELLDKAIPDRFHNGIRVDMPNLDEHGSDPTCFACHYKLDPMGRAFFTVGGNLLINQTSKSALIYKNKKGQKVEISGEGLGDIAKAIVAQPQYTECQVQHFWKWFIRRDQLPSSDRLIELVEKFEEVKRKPNDFISYLVNEPEFYSENTSSVSVGL